MADVRELKEYENKLKYLKVFEGWSKVGDILGVAYTRSDIGPGGKLKVVFREDESVDRVYMTREMGEVVEDVGSWNSAGDVKQILRDAAQWGREMKTEDVRGKAEVGNNELETEEPEGDDAD